VKYAWIERHQKHWPISLQCEVLNVSVSGYFEHRRRNVSGQPVQPGKRLSDEALLVHIKVAHAANKGEYGWPRIWRELRANGVRVGKERIRRLMKQHDIKARGKRKFVVTTDSKHNLPIAPNLLNRNFQPEQPNTAWAGDITYIQTEEGWLYLAVVLDLYSRQVVGWSMQPHMQTSLVADALRMAWFRRRPEPGLIFHSDRGSQYCSQAFQQILAEYGMQSSMSRKGNCWDNAPTESLWGSLKVGRLYGMRFEMRRQAMDEVIDWLTYYNYRRLHSTLGYISPMQFEQNWFAAQLKDAA
jgi:transposase InsO family protein